MVMWFIVESFYNLSYHNEVIYIGEYDIPIKNSVGKQLCLFAVKGNQEKLLIIPDVFLLSSLTNILSRIVTSAVHMGWVNLMTI